MSARRSGMPRRSRAFDAPPRIVTGLVTRRYTSCGRPFIDVQDPVTGEEWTVLVPIMGGSPDSFDYVPPTEPTSPLPTLSPDYTTAAQVRLLVPSDGATPDAIGILPHPLIALATLTPATAGTVNTDRTSEPSETDRAIVHGGSRVLVGADGSITDVIGPGAAIKVRRIQLGVAGKLRVSRGLPGVGTADDAPVLYTRLLAYCAALEARVNALDATVTAMAAAFVAVLPGAPVLSPNPAMAAYVPGPAPVAAHATLASACFDLSGDARNLP